MQREPAADSSPAASTTPATAGTEALMGALIDVWVWLVVFLLGGLIGFVVGHGRGSRPRSCCGPVLRDLPEPRSRYPPMPRTAVHQPISSGRPVRQPPRQP